LNFKVSIKNYTLGVNCYEVLHNTEIHYVIGSVKRIKRG